MIKSIKNKFRMFGVNISDYSIFGGNNAVVLNSSSPESVLKRKHHSNNYHYVRESVVSGVALIFKADSGHNLADIFTKGP